MKSKPFLGIPPPSLILLSSLLPPPAHSQTFQNTNMSFVFRLTRYIPHKKPNISSVVNFRSSYHEKVIDHYENPRNVGTLDKTSPTVGTGLVGAPACGDVMRLQIQVDPITSRITDARFKTFGCGSAIASSSLATEWIKGRTLEEAQQVKNNQIARELCLPPVKLHCSMLAEDAIKSAVADYQKKQQTDTTKATSI